MFSHLSFSFNFLFRINQFDAEIDKLKNLGITLDSTNIQNYLNAVRAEKAELKKIITDKDEE